jgi:hypothetical protein
VTDREAYVLRETTGTSGVIQTARSVGRAPPLRRHKDRTDVIELILRRKLPRTLKVAPVIQPLYWETG